MIDPKNLLDTRPTNYCEGCRRETGTTVCALCAKCSAGVIRDRRVRFPRSEGDVFMRKTFGRAFKRYYTKAAQ